MKKTRVLHVIDKMDKGGAETLIMNLYRNIDRNKIQFDFLVSSNEKGQYDDEIIELGGEIFTLPYPKNVSSVPKYILDLKKLFLDNQYNVVHSHIHFFSGLIAYVAKRSKVKNIISHSHTTSDGKKSGFSRELYRKIMRYQIISNSNYLVGCGEAASTHLFGKIYKDKNVQINNGVDIDRYKTLQKTKSELLSELQIPEDSYVIGHIGRFVELKNHSFMIDVLNEILKRRSNSYLILVGTGNLLQKVQGKVKEFGLEDNVRFLGLRNDIPELLNAFDCFLLPSVYEGLPTVLVEAQTIGIPCFVSDTVSKESDMGIGNYESISLTKNASYWADTILNSGYCKNDLAYRKIIEKGYSIKHIVEKIEEVYLN